MTAPSAKALTRAFGGDWHGTFGLVPGPGHSARDRSLKVWDADGGVKVHSFAGDDWRDCRKHLGLDGTSRTREVPWQPPKPKPQVVYCHTKDAPRDTRRACDIWRATCGTFPADSPAGRYLIGRGIPPPWPETLAFGRLFHSETRERVPALIVARQCPVVGMVRGVQRIYLTEAGGKYERGTVKKSLGKIAGGRAQLIRPDDKLIICEGVESALSAWRLFRTPAWAICGGFPTEMHLPERVRSVQIVADHDLSGGSERRGRVLAQSIRASGRSCTVIMPVEPGADANAVAMAGVG